MTYFSGSNPEDNSALFDPKISHFSKLVESEKVDTDLIYKYVESATWKYLFEPNCFFIEHGDFIQIDLVTMMRYENIEEGESVSISKKEMIRRHKEFNGLLSSRIRTIPQ